MPRARTRGQRARISGLNKAKKMQLQFGFNFFNDPDPYPLTRREYMVKEILWVTKEFSADTLAEMKKDWEANRDLLLAEFAKSSTSPDSVCFAAWVFDQGHRPQDFRK